MSSRLATHILLCHRVHICASELGVTCLELLPRCCWIALERKLFYSLVTPWESTCSQLWSLSSHILLPSSVWFCFVCCFAVLSQLSQSLTMLMAPTVYHLTYCGACNQVTSGLLWSLPQPVVLECCFPKYSTSVAFRAQWYIGGCHVVESALNTVD